MCLEFVYRYSEEVLVMVVLHDFLHQLTLSFWNFYYSLFSYLKNKKD